MITHPVTVEIDRPITAVFEWLTNAFNHPRWDRSSVEMEPLEPGPWREGFAFREVRRIGMRKLEIRSHIAAIDPPTSMDLQRDTGPSFNGHWRLAERYGGTTLRWSCEMQPDALGSSSRWPRLHARRRRELRHAQVDPRARPASFALPHLSLPRAQPRAAGHVPSSS